MRITYKKYSIDSKNAGDSAFRLHRRGDRGQALVELALIFPVFILLLVGAAEFGRLAYAAIEITDAARAAVAYGAQSGITASDSTGMQTAAVNDAPNVAGISAIAKQYCSCSSGGSVSCTNALASCASPARVIEYVQVNTTASVNTIFKYPGLPKIFTMTGQAIMRVEQ